jgi:hypothetical protein
VCFACIFKCRGCSQLGRLCYPDPEAGAVESVTLKALRHGLEARGWALHPTRLSVTGVVLSHEIVQGNKELVAPYGRQGWLGGQMC